jgi:DNA-binding response OmpR family regulator
MSTAPIILIADRNDDAPKYLQEELATADYTLLHAKDGREALSLVETQPSPIAFAVVELELPGANGLHLIGRLTSQEPKPKKIIATTFLEDEVLFEIATHMGADVIAQKPCPWKMSPLFRPGTPKQASSTPHITPP